MILQWLCAACACQFGDITDPIHLVQSLWQQFFNIVFFHFISHIEQIVLSRAQLAPGKKANYGMDNANLLGIRSSTAVIFPFSQLTTLVFFMGFSMVPVHGTGKFFQYLGHHLPPIPSTITRIKFLILCTILLCSAQHILIQKNPQNHILTFGQQKTSNEHYHSNQSPIFKFSPSDYLHFLIIFPSADINCFWAIKPFIQPYSNFTMLAILVFWP